MVCRKTLYSRMAGLAMSTIWRGDKRQEGSREESTRCTWGRSPWFPPPKWLPLGLVLAESAMALVMHSIHPCPNTTAWTAPMSSVPARITQKKILWNNHWMFYLKSCKSLIMFLISKPFEDDSQFHNWNNFLISQSDKIQNKTFPLNRNNKQFRHVSHNSFQRFSCCLDVDWKTLGNCCW